MAGPAHLGDPLPKAGMKQFGLGFIERVCQGEQIISCDLPLAQYERPVGGGPARESTSLSVACLL